VKLYNTVTDIEVHVVEDDETLDERWTSQTMYSDDRNFTYEIFSVIYSVDKTSVPYNIYSRTGGGAIERSNT
jgi:hypothetical protein